MITLPDEFQLKSPYYNNFADKDDPAALLYIEQQHAIIDKFVAETLYIKFVDGDRKGSIAKVKPNVKTFGDNAAKKATIEYSYSTWDKNNKYRFTNDHFYGICSWDGRKNKVQVSLPNKEFVFLPNYEGPTVWALFDHQAAKAEVLKNPGQYDIDGELLAVGDYVLYINARYGYGMELCHGTITEFKAVVDSKKTEISTIITKSKSDILSTISNSETMIYKR